MHSTDNMNDGYFGSGKRLWFSINYHGKENHDKEILEYCFTREELKKREKELVNSELIKDDLCMNLVVGGEGGYISIEGCRKGGNNAYKNLNYVVWTINGDENRKNISVLSKERFKIKKYRDIILKNLNWNGRKHTIETKNLISEIKKGVGLGETNSQYGTCWITKDGVNKKIKKEDLNNWINEGWIKGRKY
jgi:hypothetical protein